MLRVALGLGRACREELDKYSSVLMLAHFVSSFSYLGRSFGFSLVASNPVLGAAEQGPDGV